jgi:hypothetical protein
MRGLDTMTKKETEEIEMNPNLAEAEKHLAECWTVAKNLTKSRLKEMKDLKLTPEIAAIILDTEEKIAVHLHIEGCKHRWWAEPTPCRAEAPTPVAQPATPPVEFVKASEVKSNAQYIEDLKKLNADLAAKAGAVPVAQPIAEPSRQKGEYLTIDGKEWPVSVPCKKCGKTLKYSNSKNPTQYKPVYYRCSACQLYTNPGEPPLANGDR